LNQENIRVGLLAYGAIGDEHNQAIKATPGLSLAAVCDTNPERLKVALEISPDAKTFTDADLMIASGEIDLVVISTPPNSHYLWAKKALNTNLNVVLEKPMALTTDQCDELIALAKSKDLLLVVYQNRRYDSDFLTIKDLIEKGAIGEVFYFESFVGGYSKPCSYWHSDKEVSGGAIFDWGSHFIDQIMSVISSPLKSVSGLNQKRVWDHVTNADHSQVTLTFNDGVQAVFTNSDLSAARKPKYFVLGTKGSIVGEWDHRSETVTDLPAIIYLFHPDGKKQAVEKIKPTPFSFHQSLVNYLLNKTPMSVTAQQSRDVVAVMQAAEDSASSLGALKEPVLLRK
jgi:scyllo-inositol 2-dehydrogenase (NADP+)